MKRVHIISSTHWDREWYEPFELYRGRLVRMIDNLLSIMEKDENFRYFHFDGQTIMLKDYLEIRPENKERLYNLIKNGRIKIGPWYTMPDEFLINGEALVRNLQKGNAVCNELGVKSDTCGYVCDIFGHNSQLPQIMSGFGIDNVAAFRGEDNYDGDNVLWQGADGTKVILHRLHPTYSYSQFYFVGRKPFEEKPFDEKEFIDRFKKYFKEEEPFIKTDSVLMLDGVDHIDPDPQVPRLIKLLNENIKGYEFVHSCFENYTKEVKQKINNLNEVNGALYNVNQTAHWAGLLKNVLSSQVHLKQANDRCETGLALDLEILDCFVSDVRDNVKSKYKGMYPYGGFFDKAWEILIQNQAHDSICGCSMTPVHQDNENRFKHVEEIIQTVKQDIERNFAKHVNIEGKGRDGAILVLNQSQNDIKGTTEIYLDIPYGKSIREFTIYDCKDNEIPFNIIGYDVIQKNKYDYGELVSMPRFERFKLAIRLEIPAFSYTTLTYKCLRRERGEYFPQFSIYDAPNRYLGSMRVASNVVDNGKLVMKVNANGTLDITDKITGKRYHDMLMIEESGDAGEGWNYFAPLCNEEINSVCQNAQYKVLNDTSNYFRCKIIVELNVPERSDGTNRAKSSSVCKVEHIITLKRDSEQIDIKTKVDNKQTNHRLRVVFPTELKTETFKTSTPFDLYEWQIKKKDWSHALETDTLVNPNQGLVTLTDGKNTFSLYNKGLYEVSVTDRNDCPVFLTLFRSFTAEAGLIEGDMGKLLDKPLVFEYAMDFSNVSESELVKKANAFKVKPVCISVQNDGKSDSKMEKEKTFMRISGEAILSSLRKEKKIKNNTWTVLRLYNVTDKEINGYVNFNKEIEEACVSNLAENDILETINYDKNCFQYRIKSKEIKTYLIR